MLRRWSRRSTTMVTAGEQFVILDLPAELVDQVAAATRDWPVTLLNATAPEDFLRERCYPNLLHTAASDRMTVGRAGAVLRIRNWTKVLMLVGPEPRDKSMAAAFRASAERQRFNIVDEREFTLATDPANREENNTLLITGGVDYDVVFVADSQGEFARYLPYDTQLPRPGRRLDRTRRRGVAVDAGIGTARPQVTSRFEDADRRTADDRAGLGDLDRRQGDRHRLCQGADSDDYRKIADYLRGNRLKIDGSKGVQLNFRPWDGQMRHADRARDPQRGDRRSAARGVPAPDQRARYARHRRAGASSVSKRAAICGSGSTPSPGARSPSSCARPSGCSRRWCGRRCGCWCSRRACTTCSASRSCRPTRPIRRTRNTSCRG